MIAKNYNWICTNVTKVENYEEAKNSPDLYVLHHLAECRFTSAELKEMDRYYHRPPEELLFVEVKMHTANRNLHIGNRSHIGLFTKIMSIKMAHKFKEKTGIEPLENWHYFLNFVKKNHPFLHKLLPRKAKYTKWADIFSSG